MKKDKIKQEKIVEGCIKILQTRTDTSTRIIADLLLLDLSKNKGTISSELESIFCSIEELRNGKLK